MGVSFKTLAAAGLVLAGAVAVEPAPAEAQPRWGRYHGDGYAPHGLRQRYYAPRYYGGGRYYGARGYYGYGPRRYYGYGYPYGYYRRPNYGGAVAAGVIGGLALGAAASAAANPYYAPGYYAPARCVVERRRVVGPYGRVVVRRIRTCY
ncbi:hypothetical protein [Microvirga mediterraneensis]|uniref:Uncharacterized protein n=1 Tax=Microvirga mediterraneensis TaxID=2754695 RepID=A0A838BIE0_9HYPH|nr:hypothetical protein [Microvirga mediterraneensis]MBA1155298.1 hypothetical protein [Microvirga mediterraneensis]